MPKSEFQNRIDRLTLTYMEHHCDISSLTPAEYLREFTRIANELIDVMQGKQVTK